MNKMNVDFLKAFYERIEAEEEAKINAKIREEFIKKARMMIASGIISEDDFKQASNDKGVPISEGPKPRGDSY